MASNTLAHDIRKLYNETETLAEFVEKAEEQGLLDAAMDSIDQVLWNIINQERTDNVFGGGPDEQAR